MISCVKSLPEFYQDVIISYNKSKVINYEDFCNNVLNPPIWGNKFIKFKNKTLFFKNWIAEGIVSVKNLKIRNGVYMVYIYRYALCCPFDIQYRCVFILHQCMVQKPCRANHFHCSNKVDSLNIYVIDI